MEKKMKNFLFILLIFIISTGCAQMIETSDDLGGVQNGNRWGVIKYSSATRQDAKKKMIAYCRNGQYKIISVNDSSDVIYANGTPVPRQHNTAKFECISNNSQL